MSKGRRHENNGSVFSQLSAFSPAKTASPIATNN